MKVLLLGSGGREHALAWALSKSSKLTRLWCAPGNPGIAQVATCININVMDQAGILAFCRQEQIDFVVVGPEAPLVEGLVDFLAAKGVLVFGPSKYAAQLEGSKGFTKDLCLAHNIPTAAYGRFTDEASAIAYLGKVPAPIVVKADGLAAGKGVTVAMSDAEALAAVREIFRGRFGEASCVIEDFLEGEEASFFVLSDGETVLPLATAQDHKRIGDGDVGPNTGGMGAYSPAPCMTEALCVQVLEEIIKPTVRALAGLGHPYRGVLYAGLMLTREGPKLIEYNARFGDPETQVLMPRLDSDLLELLLACAQGRLKDVSARWKPESALTVVMAAKGYPGDYTKGNRISGLDDLPDGAIAFHAGTSKTDGALVTSGGRVFNITALGKTISEAQAHAYRAVSHVSFDGAYWRKDIGWRAM
jgi:phosphoribosylamine---glycine ligase